MSAIESFFDTNTLLYLISDDMRKATRSEVLLGQGGTISMQVLNEFAAVTRRKHKMDWSAVRDMPGKFRAAFEVVPVTEASQLKAMDLAERHQFSVYDANIVAAAQLAGCTTLFSEDMQDGMVLDGLTIKNPYLE